MARNATRQMTAARRLDVSLPAEMQVGPQDAAGNQAWGRAFTTR
ncbi:hypothetical protein [Mycolicibacterium obuense]|nr:hypothetical protein [Mycolicibacterium obuense]